MLLLFGNQILMAEQDGRRPDETGAITLMLAAAPTIPAAYAACECDGHPG
jgi:hypothetical protein